MTETKFCDYMKNVDSTTVICDEIGGITVIQNLVRPPADMDDESNIRI